MFVSNKTFQDGSVALCEGARDGFVELEGSPEMVLEIVSDSSVRKDKTELMKRYAEAGIQEYWLVDARKPPIEFTIYQLDGIKYKTVPSSKDGFILSGVFNDSFRLVQSENPAGHPQFSLEKISA
jgi:Uma2 family endonuclease